LSKKSWNWHGKDGCDIFLVDLKVVVMILFVDLLVDYYFSFYLFAYFSCFLLFFYILMIKKVIKVLKNII